MCIFSGIEQYRFWASHVRDELQIWGIVANNPSQQQFNANWNINRHVLCDVLVRVKQALSTLAKNVIHKQ